MPTTETWTGPKCPTCGQAVHRSKTPTQLSKAVAALWLLSLFAALVIGLVGYGWATAGVVAAVGTGLMLVYAVVTQGGMKS